MLTKNVLGEKWTSLLFTYLKNVNFKYVRLMWISTDVITEVIRRARKVEK
mgnify:CR=1 FL=1